jgi:diguanylate cyclase (GGDEF)-like protein
MRTVLRAAVLAVLGLLVTAALTWNGISRVRAGFAELDRARDSVLRYEAVRDAVSAEAFAEAAYRRAPGPSTRGALTGALGAVPGSLRDLSLSPDPSDQAVARQLTILNTRYAGEVRSSLARPGGAPATSVDDRVAGPALDTMGGLIAAGISGHRAQARESRDEQSAIISRLALELPLVVALCLALVVACGTVMVRQHLLLDRRERESRWSAEHDGLTGIPNRHLMWRRLDAALDAAGPTCALMLLDLNKFKAINDTYGHAAGDEVLVATARRLTEAAPEPCLVARLGGDEFAVFVPDAAQAAAVADRVRTAMSERILLSDGKRVTCSGTIGVAVAHTGSDRVELLRAADLDMYDGKPRRGGVPTQRVGEPGARSATA